MGLFYLCLCSNSPSELQPHSEINFGHYFHSLLKTYQTESIELTLAYKVAHLSCVCQCLKYFP